MVQSVADGFTRQVLILLTFQVLIVLVSQSTGSKILDEVETFEDCNKNIISNLIAALTRSGQNVYFTGRDNFQEYGKYSNISENLMDWVNIKVSAPR